MILFLSLLCGLLGIICLALWFDNRNMRRFLFRWSHQNDLFLNEIRKQEGVEL